ncbi:hypothetical protein [Nocardia pseudovaccinii]|uniref:hypothetical protein n=1 Tax=Nocardia pseudovaccinii TaxID=189540 RepID=UPI0007C7D733|nr:hypothetical protein [Nocardia pseudovaccinii]
MFESTDRDEPSARPGGSLAALPRAQQLDLLRARMAAIPGRVGADTRPPPAQATDLLAAVPGGLGELLPDGGLARGSVVSCTGGGSIMLALLAAATSAGVWAAVLGAPRLGLLAFHELGGDLARLAHIAQPGDDPLAIAGVLLEGVGVVALDAPGSAAPTRARAIVTRARSHGSVLIVTSDGWARPDIEIRSRIAGYTGLGRGHGLVKDVHLDVRVTGRAARTRTARLVLTGAGIDRTQLTRATSVDAATTMPERQVRIG